MVEEEEEMEEMEEVEEEVLSADQQEEHVSGPQVLYQPHQCTKVTAL